MVGFRGRNPRRDGTRSHLKPRQISPRDLTRFLLKIKKMGLEDDGDGDDRTRRARVL